MYICNTCGTQHAETSLPPEHCIVCEDDRQYIGWDGQTWTTHDELHSKYALRIEEENGLLAIGFSTAFAIPQRMLLLPTDAGNILWESISLVTDKAIAALNERGGVDKIVISHPHFYSSMVEWSDALGGAPILLHAADQQWVLRHSPNIQFWEGDEKILSPDVTLIRCGGHFPGSTALHWKGGPRKGGALFPGDAMQVASDRRHVSFMYSYPNYIPMKPADVLAMRTRLATYQYEDVFGFTWNRNIIGEARAATDASFARYLQAVSVDSETE